ncbi:hypothetical protein [Pseudoduganella namucuonensis]|nr:hypothetical protein [Pseudoduganella namucuonensis]
MSRTILITLVERGVWRRYRLNGFSSWLDDFEQDLHAGWFTSWVDGE